MGPFFHPAKNSFTTRWVVVLALTFSSGAAHAQDLEPRAYVNTPVGLNFLIAGYVHSNGSLGTDPSVPLDNAQVKLNTAVVACVRTLDLWGSSAKFDVIVPHTWASGSAKLFGERRTGEVSGFNDPRLRLSIGLRRTGVLA